MNLLENKNVLIVGVANKHSIAAGIAESMTQNGANVALTYQNDRLKTNVEKLGQIGVLKFIFLVMFLRTTKLKAFSTNYHLAGMV